VDPKPKPRSLGELISRTKIPPNKLGIFWPGGVSMVFKTVRQRVYLFDPMVCSWAGGSRVGAIDIRPDMVFSSVAPGDDLDLSALTHLASAYPETCFVSSAACRDAMIGRHTDNVWDEIPIEPRRVHALEQELRMDVRQLGVADSFRARVLYEEPDKGAPPWNLLLSFGNLQICVIQSLDNQEDVAFINESIRRRIDVLLWSFPGAPLSFAGEILDHLRPGYAIPFAYDRLHKGRDLARKFRDLVGRIPGVKTYLFSEDYMEGLLYSRIMSRKRRFE